MDINMQETGGLTSYPVGGTHPVPPHPSAPHLGGANQHANAVNRQIQENFNIKKLMSPYTYISTGVRSKQWRNGYIWINTSLIYTYLGWIRFYEIKSPNYRIISMQNATFDIVRFCCSGGTPTHVTRTVFGDGWLDKPTSSLKSSFVTSYLKHLTIPHK